jgi:hypothetical protein
LEQLTISEIVFKRDGLLEVGFESQICFDSSFVCFGMDFAKF